MRWTISFAQFRDEAILRGILTTRLCSPYHWRIENVNIWPTKGKIQRDGGKVIYVEQCDRWPIIKSLIGN